MSDKLKERRAYIGSTSDSTDVDKKIIINLESALPFIHIDDKIISTMSVKTMNYSKYTQLENDLEATLIDPEYSDANNGDHRFTFITSFTSPVTKNIVRVYHDAKYSDIIVIPDLRFYAGEFGKGLNIISGNAVGYYDSKDQLDIVSKIPLKSENKVKITNVNENLVSSTHILLITSSERGAFDTKINIGRNSDSAASYDEVVFESTVVLELGLGKDIIPDNKKIPMYLARQSRPECYDLIKSGTVDVTNLKLFFILKF